MDSCPVGSHQNRTDSPHMAWREVLQSELKTGANGESIKKSFYNIVINNNALTSMPINDIPQPPYCYISFCLC